MYKKRKLVEGAFYHVISRTNNKIRVFENRLGRKIMLIVLEGAKDKFRFMLTNFVVMPTHFHLLIKPTGDTQLSSIMHWIKLHSARSWNFIHGSKDHLWGQRYYARAIGSPYEYDKVMNYIDQNPVKAGLSSTPAEWKASGAFYKANNIKDDIVDFSPDEKQRYVKLLSPIPPAVSWLLPPAQNSYILQHYGAYIEDIDWLYKLIPALPRIGESAAIADLPPCLHYSTGTADYYIYEYDGQDTVYGEYKQSVYPSDKGYKKFSLSELKRNPHLKLDFSWGRQQLPTMLWCT